jgi:hypothetical protein
MANRANLRFMFQVMDASVVERRKQIEALLSIGEATWNECIIPAEATGVAAVVMGLGTLSNPKLLIILGAPGITYAFNDSVEQKNADPIAVESNSAGFAFQANSLVVENSSNQPRTVVVIAVE